MRPASRIDTKYGAMFSAAGHGRLVWRAKTFFSEEPDTINWLDSIAESDVLWDVGANVGLYTIYAAKFRKCRVLAFEPEAQNYALLIENLIMNGLRERVSASNVALADRSGFGMLHFRYVTKGGAYNLFQPGGSASSNGGHFPESVQAVQQGDDEGGFFQLIYGASIDDLVLKAGFPVPTHLKIDVDGLEPKIIAGCGEILKRPELISILVEINRKSTDDLRIVEVLEAHGFRLKAEHSVWDTKRERSREDLIPAANMIFSRA